MWPTVRPSRRTTRPHEPHSRRTIESQLSFSAIRSSWSSRARSTGESSQNRHDRTGSASSARWSTVRCAVLRDTLPMLGHVSRSGRVPGGAQQPECARHDLCAGSGLRGWSVRPIRQSKKLQGVRYDVRGPILVEAQRLEAEGHRILKLNIGNPAPFGFEAPEAILADVMHHLPESQGYSDSQGIYSARTAVAQYYQARGLRETDVEDVFIGNGVSELISMVLQAFVDDGNEILVPAPDYPLWTGAVTLAGGIPGP